jgi:uncharacterized protein YggE
MTDSADVGGAAAMVSVRGEATVEAEPEIAVFSVSVSARDRDRRKTLATLSRRNDQFLALVRSFGAAIEKAETSEVSVYPELRRGREEKVRWYRGTIRTRLTVSDLAVAGELVGRISDVELCVIAGPWWELKPDSPVYREARVSAARDAVTRAAQYAEAVGGRLTGLVELADTGLGGGNPARMLAAARAAPAYETEEEGPPAIDMEPETQVVQASVEARFTMTQPPSLRGGDPAR